MKVLYRTQPFPYSHFHSPLSLSNCFSEALVKQLFSLFDPLHAPPSAVGSVSAVLSSPTTWNLIDGVAFSLDPFFLSPFGLGKGNRPLLSSGAIVRDAIPFLFFAPIACYSLDPWRTSFFQPLFLCSISLALSSIFCPFDAPLLYIFQVVSQSGVTRENGPTLEIFPLFLSPLLAPL